jgi:hypothetical protein
LLFPGGSRHCGFVVGRVHVTALQRRIIAVGLRFVVVVFVVVVVVARIALRAGLVVLVVGFQAQARVFGLTRCLAAALAFFVVCVFFFLAHGSFVLLRAR